MNSRKLAANRRNAALSTGPRTPEGKLVSSRNATTHGILSAEVCLPDDDRDAFNDFAAGLMETLAPVGELERLHADRVVATAWRLRRTLRIETQILELESEREFSLSGDDDDDDNDTALGFAFVRASNSGGNPLDKLSRYETALERSLHRSLHELERLRAARQGADVPPPAVLDVELSLPPPEDG